MIQSVSANVHNIRRHVQRRQVPAACTTSCAWLTPLSNCGTTDLNCLCGIVNGAGADVQTCATCLEPTNPDISTDIQEVAELCPSSGAPPITESAGTTTESAALGATATTTTPSTVTDTDCSSLCDPIVSAEASCTVDSCFCPTVVVAGPACSQCLLNTNATVASSIGLAINICNSEFPATTGAGSTGCSSQCALINQALTACTDESCFCTTLIGEGPACSQCFATVNITEASILSGAIATCQSLLPGVTGIPSGNGTQTTKGPALTGFPSTQSTVQTVALTGSTSSSHSAGMSDFDGIFEGSFVRWVTVLALVGGVFGVFI